MKTDTVEFILVLILIILVFLGISGILFPNNKLNSIDGEELEIFCSKNYGTTSAKNVPAKCLKFFK